MAELPSDDSLSPEKEGPPRPGVIRFRHGVSNNLAEQLLSRIHQEILPNYQQSENPLSFTPITNDHGILTGLDFGAPLEPATKRAFEKDLARIITQMLERLEKDRRKSGPKDRAKNPMSFTELLGTFRVKVVYVIIPILATIASAIFLAWMAKIKAEIDINIAPFPNEASTWEIILNGVIPVLISAVFLTVIWLLIRKFGMVVFKIVMGILIFFYSWYGFFFFVEIFFIVYENSTPIEQINVALFNSLYYVLFFGSIAFFILLLVLFYSNRLNIKQRNAIVLFYSIFMGSILGISLPTWTTFSFAIFLSIWDLITVFKGPLGKIGQMIQDNQQEMQERIEAMLDSGEIGIDQVMDYTQFVSLQARGESRDETAGGEKEADGSGKGGIKMLDLKEIEIELGSGDLILYSALVANVFVNFSSWFLAGLVMVGVLAGAAMTLYFLLSRRRMLPALPFSMVFGIVLFFIGRLLQTYLIPVF